MTVHIKGKNLTQIALQRERKYFNVFMLLAENLNKNIAI